MIVRVYSRGWNVISSPGPLLALGRLWTEYSRAGATVILLLPLFTSPFFLYVHKRPAKLVCKLLMLLSFHPFPARPIVPVGDSKGVVDSPRPGLLWPLQPLPVSSLLPCGAVFPGFVSAVWSRMAPESGGTTLLKLVWDELFRDQICREVYVLLCNVLPGLRS